MDRWANIYTQMGGYIPLLAGIAIISLLLWLINRLMLGRHLEMGAEARLPRQLLMLLFSLIGLLTVLLLIPMSDTTRGQVLSLLGIVFTGVIALSSTTFVANAMAGLMLRLIRSFRPGDFIRIGNQFGKVTERGLFHSEIQTEDRDLTTFPNLHLITNPVTVVHSTGTIIATQLSLGYDVPRPRIEELLKQAAEDTGLQDPFVLLDELGDYSVTYRVAGFLPDVNRLLTARSNLRKNVMDSLHEDQIEIVSPRFINQRVLSEDQKILAKASYGLMTEQPGGNEEAPENMMFDKADKISQLEQARSELDKLNQQLAELKKQNSSEAEAGISQLEETIATLQKHIDELNKLVKSHSSDTTE